MNIIIFGPSGSGKGTQAELLSKKLKISTVSMGKLFRQAYDKGTPEGIEAYHYWGKGNWVPGDLTFKVLKPAVDRCSKGFILDGYPRRKDQIPPLERYLKKRNQKVDWTILLWISDKEAVKRLLLRAKKDAETKGKARIDETKEVIKARLASYHRTVGPIIEYFRQQGILMEVDGERPIEVIHQDILSKLKISELVAGGAISKLVADAIG